jgi:hypothetical protein
MNYYFLLLIPVGIGFFIGFWCLVVKMISLVAWQPLARHFAVAELPAGPRFGLGQARLGFVSYRGAVSAAVTPEGLGLAAVSLFRVGHQPLLIPWSALGPFRAEKVFWTTFYTTQIRTSTTAHTKLTFNNSDIVAAARPWLQVEEAR